MKLYDVELRYVNRQVKSFIHLVDSKDQEAVEYVVRLEMRKQFRNDLGEFIWSDWREVSFV